jgi:hypothetical protein
MAKKAIQLDEVWSLALRLSLPDKMRLVERIANWFEHQLEEPNQTTQLATSTPLNSWGAELAQDIQSGELDTSAWIAMDIPDSVEWLKELRQKEHLERAGRI